jgi:hypothetical protein
MLGAVNLGCNFCQCSMTEMFDSDDTVQVYVKNLLQCANAYKVC